MSATARVRYSAGPWLGLVRGRCLVVLPADASEETAAVAWDLLAGTPGVEQLLATVLSGRLDLTGLPSFAIVSFRDGQTLHAILRGEVALRMTCADGGTTELIGTGISTWNERVVRDIESFELLVDDAIPCAESLPLETGAVRLSSLHADLAVQGEDSVVPDLDSTVVPGAADPTEGQADVTPAPTEGPSTGHTTQIRPADEDELDEAIVDHDVDDDVNLDVDGDDVDDRTIANAPPRPEQPRRPPEQSPHHRSLPQTGPVPGPQELIDSVPWLAAARKTVSPQSAPASAPEPQLVEVPSDLGMTVAPAEHLDADDADDADTVMSPGAGAIPNPAPGPVAATAPPAAPPSGPPMSAVFPDDADHDGQTVMKSDLDLGALAGANEPAVAPASAQPVSTGPVVLARQCSKGHANPPTNSTCGICGQSLGGEAQQLRRPSLGRIRMCTGEVLELDRPAVIGRQPQAHRVGSGTMPRMIQVRSPNGDISRSHCEVVLEGWHVQLRDLKATNGTVLIREGQSPRRLGQGESIMVLDGDIADLGDGVSLRFEGLL